MHVTVVLDDRPVAVIKLQGGKAVAHYIYSDHLNTPRVIARASDNKTVWRWTGLGPYGENLPEDNPSGLGVFSYNLGFPGQIADQESGL